MYFSICRGGFRYMVKVVSRCNISVLLEKRPLRHVIKCKYNSYFIYSGTREFLTIFIRALKSSSILKAILFILSCLMQHSYILSSREYRLGNILTTSVLNISLSYLQIIPL